MAVVDGRAADGRRGVVSGPPRRVRHLREARGRVLGRLPPRARPRRRVRHPAGARRVHGRRRAVRPGRVDGDPHVCRLPHRHPQQGARHAPLHRPRRLDGARGRAGRRALAAGPLRPLRGRAGRARALRRARGLHHGRRDARDVRGAGARSPLRCRDPAARARRRAAGAGRSTRRRGGARGAGRSRRHCPRGGPDHGDGGRGRDPRVGPHARPRGRLGALLRGSRQTRAQGPRRASGGSPRSSPSPSACARERAAGRSTADLRRRSRRDGARAHHARAVPLRAGLPRRLRRLDGIRARGARGGARRRREGRGRARGARLGRVGGRGPPRPGESHPPARETRAADPLGRLGGRRDGAGDPPRDDVGRHRLLRAQALDEPGRALPPSGLRVPAGVEAVD